MREPQAVLGAALRQLGYGDVRLPIDGHGRARLSPGHTVAGNPGRMRSGPTRIAADVEWMDRMAADQR